MKSALEYLCQFSRIRLKIEIHEIHTIYETQCVFSRQSGAASICRLFSRQPTRRQITSHVGTYESANNTDRYLHLCMSPPPSPQSFLPRFPFSSVPFPFSSLPCKPFPPTFPFPRYFGTEQINKVILSDSIWFSDSLVEPK